MSRIIISEFMDETAIARLHAAHDTLYDPTLVDDPGTLATHLVGAQALIVRNRTQVTGDLIANAPQLSTIGRLGVGLDNIDLEACKSKGITVYPATGANNLAVAEYVISTSMMLLRGAYLSSDSVAAGDWPRQALIGREISGKVMGLVGFGGIAQEVAIRARALGMSICAHDPFIDPNDPAWQQATSLSLPDLAAQSDVISLHVPLTDTTRNLIGADFLARMKPGAALINTARGGVVDEAALAQAMRSGHIGGAALDVFESEPLGQEKAAAFDGLSNLILTPHIAGVTTESNIRVSAMIADKILEHLASPS